MNLFQFTLSECLRIHKNDTTLKLNRELESKKVSLRIHKNDTTLKL